MLFVSSIKNLEPSFKNFVSEISNDNQDNKFENIEQEKFSKKIKFETPKSIRFENVNFTYDDNNKFSLKNINLEIKKIQFVEL